MELSPIKTIEFVLDDGRIMNLFLKYNPRKLIAINNDQIVYQHCVFCGDKRYDDKKFRQINLRIEDTILCNKVECLSTFHDFVKHKPGASINFMIFSHIEKLQSN